MSDKNAPEPEAKPEARWQDEVSRLEIVSADRVRIWRDGFRRLHITVDGAREHVDVRPAPVFPVSEAAAYVSFLDSNDKEVVLLEGMSGLDCQSRSVLTEEMGRAYFVPRIVCIYAIEDAHGAARWQVETDRGPRVFDVRDREDVRVVRRTRVLLQDADGNRFEIEDISALDERSRRLLDLQI